MGSFTGVFEWQDRVFYSLLSRSVWPVQDCHLAVISHINWPNTLINKSTLVIFIGCFITQQVSFIIFSAVIITLSHAFRRPCCRGHFWSSLIQRKHPEESIVWHAQPQQINLVCRRLALAIIHSAHFPLYPARPWLRLVELLTINFKSITPYYGEYTPKHA